MISIRCPHCRIALKVDRAKLPPDITSFRCPKCKEPIPVSILPQEGNAVPDETALIKPLKRIIGTLTVIGDSETPEQMFPLYEGKIIIGRQSSGATRTNIAIQTGDKSMSREHICIEVKKDAKGGYKHFLSDNNSKNHTLYNSNYLGEGEVVVLNDNDEIIIGRTILRFNE